jgi:hypothetical protein
MIKEKILELIDRKERGMTTLSKTKFNEREMWIKELNDILLEDETN